MRVGCYIRVVCCLFGWCLLFLLDSVSLLIFVALDLVVGGYLLTLVVVVVGSSVWLHDLGCCGLLVALD